MSSLSKHRTDTMASVPILTHGSEMSTAPTVGPIVRQLGVDFRTALQRLANTGIGALQLDATLRGMRPRELDGSARRNLKALLTRSDIRLAGIDQFLPRRHFLDPAEQDRAVHATLAALELAADLGRVPLSIAVPVAEAPKEILDALAEAADARGQPLAIHAEDQFDALESWLQRVDQPVIGASIDPAAIIATGQDALAATHRLGPRLLVGRLSDISDTAAAGGLRCAAGEGLLNLHGYRVALDLCSSRLGPVVVDVRGVVNPTETATQSIQAWEDATFGI